MYYHQWKSLEGHGTPKIVQANFTSNFEDRLAYVDPYAAAQILIKEATNQKTMFVNEPIKSFMFALAGFHVLRFTTCSRASTGPNRYLSKEASNQ